MPDNIAGFDPHRDSQGFTYDSELAEKPIRFAEKYLTHTTGRWARKPFLLEPWQKTLVRNTFGWVDEHGHRRVKEILLEVGRKNGKTFIASLYAWFMLCCDGEQGGQVILAANSREQAGLLFSVLEQQFHNSAPLQAKCKLLASRHRIIYPTTNSTISVISAEGSQAHGLSPSCVVYDEMHGARNRDLFDALHSGFGARQQPIFLTISTSGNDKQSIFHEVHEYGEKVKAGTITDPSFLPAIFTIPKEADIFDESNWPLANPNIGISPSLDFLRREAKKAQAIPAYENTFRQLYGCQWTEQKSRWLSVESWDKCCQAYPEEINTTTGWLGLDLSSNNDVTAAAMSFMVGDTLHVVPHFFIPQETAEDHETNRKIPYSLWCKNPANNLHIIPGKVIDYDYITDTVLGLCEKYFIAGVFYDRYRHSNVTTRLEQQAVEVIAHGQDFASMTSPCLELERLILTGKLNHGGNEILRHMAGAVEVRTDEGGRIRPVKPEYKSQQYKIDGIVGLLMSISGHIGQQVYYDPATFLADVSPR